jgi:hypothetical protein
LKPIQEFAIRRAGPLLVHSGGAGFRSSRRGRCSKNELQAHLHAPGRVRSTDLTGRRRTDLRAACAVRRSAGRVLVGVHEIGAIEGIEHLPPERRPHLLIDAKIPVYACILVEVAGALENQKPRVAEGELLGIRNAYVSNQ